MKLKTVILTIACAASSVVSAASLNDVQSNVVPGEWTSSYSVAKKYAEDNGVPMLVFWSSPGCAKCSKMQEIALSYFFDKYQ